MGTRIFLPLDAKFCARNVNCRPCTTPAYRSHSLVLAKYLKSHPKIFSGQIADCTDFIMYAAAIMCVFYFLLIATNFYFDIDACLQYVNVFNTAHCIFVVNDGMIGLTTW